MAAPNRGKYDWFFSHLPFWFTHVLRTVDQWMDRCDLFVAVQMCRSERASVHPARSQSNDVTRCRTSQAGQARGNRTGTFRALSRWYEKPVFALPRQQHYNIAYLIPFSRASPILPSQFFRPGPRAARPAAPGPCTGLLEISFLFVQGV